MAEIKFVKADKLKEKVDVSTIGFGTHFTDYMFRMDYNPQEGWHGASIVPYEEVKVSPANTVRLFSRAARLMSPRKASRFSSVARTTLLV